MGWTKADMPSLFDRAIRAALTAAAMKVEGDAKLLSPYRFGRLRGSITTEVKGQTAYIGTNVEYAPHVEYGTKRMKAQPYLRPAIDNNRKIAQRIFSNELKKQLGAANRG